MAWEDMEEQEYVDHAGVQWTAKQISPCLLRCIWCGSSFSNGALVLEDLSGQVSGLMHEECFDLREGFEYAMGKDD